MRKINKMILIILLSIVLIISVPLYSNAETPKSLGEVISGADKFLSYGDAPKNETQIQGISKFVSNTLLTIAVSVTLISAAIMAINFIVQSVEDKAKIKESMVPWIIGIIISFGAYGIWRITMGLFS